MTTKWQVDYTDEFGVWWVGLQEPVQDAIDRVVRLLEDFGPTLGFPYSSEIRGSAIALRELRVQQAGHPYRILYAFDPQRSALLLLGGDKTGNENWYAQKIPIAERLFAEHLQELETEKKNGTSL